MYLKKQPFTVYIRLISKQNSIFTYETIKNDTYNMPSKSFY